MQNARPSHENVIARPDAPQHFMALKSLDHLATATLGDARLAASRNALRLQEVGRGLYDPVVYFPRADVAMEHLVATEKTTHCPLKGNTTYFDVQLGDQRFENAAWSYTDIHDFDDRLSLLKDRIAFDSTQIQIIEWTAAAPDR